MTTVEDLIERCMPIPECGCWVWTGCLVRGYGQTTTIGRKRGYVHRIVYEALRGPIPAGLVIDHLCRVPSCCNPDHLEPVTHRTNSLRGVGASALAAKKTHCPNGHPYSGANLYLRKNGVRECRTCLRATDLRRRHTRRKKS